MIVAPKPPPDGAPVLLLEEVAWLLGRISVRSVRRLIDQGKLPAIRVTVGGSLRVARDEVERYLRAESFTVRPPQEPDARTAADRELDRLIRRTTVKADWNTGEDPFEEKPGRKPKRAK